MPKTKPTKHIRDFHVRLFVEDVEYLKRRAEETGGRWHIELRQLVHRALQRERVIEVSPKLIQETHASTQPVPSARSGRALPSGSGKNVRHQRTPGRDP